MPSDGRRCGASSHRVEGTAPGDVAVGPTLHHDMISGLRYYRANIRAHLFSPDARSTTVLTLEIVNTRDIALRSAIFDNTPRYTDGLWRRDLPDRHWLPYSRPELLAENAIDFIESIISGEPSATVARARVTGDTCGAVEGRCPSSPAGGSGIGRETALLLAAEGGEVVIADIDLGAAQKTADEITGSGRAQQGRLRPRRRRQRRLRLALPPPSPRPTVSPTSSSTTPGSVCVARIVRVPAAHWSAVGGGHKAWQRGESSWTASSLRSP